MGTKIWWQQGEGFRHFLRLDFTFTILPNRFHTWNHFNMQMILDVTSDMAALEVGGGPWFNTWTGKTATPEILKRALGVPLDVEGLFGLAPFFKPPGL